MSSVKTERKTILLTPELKRRLEQLMIAYPERYETESHVFRCAVMILCNAELDENGRRKKPLGY